MKNRNRIMGVVGVGLLLTCLLTGCSGDASSRQEEKSTPIQQETQEEAPKGMEASAETSGTEAVTGTEVVTGTEKAIGTEAVTGTTATGEQSVQTVQSESEKPEPGPATLLYMGHASIRIITDEGKVIYIDPYAGDDYDMTADMILVTHAHTDHSQTDKVKNRNQDCQMITQEEAIQNGEHQVFTFDYVTVEAVEAGYNPQHDVSKCVGYVLTFSNGKSIYVTGDTSKTEQMPLMAEKEIDYAFFCCDGVYNMVLTEAAECAGLVGAKHNIPYHMTTNTSGKQFDRNLAEKFDAPDCLIVEPGEEILIE